MRNTSSALYSSNISNLDLHLYNAVERGLAGGSGYSTVFFRADDIGVPSAMFAAMISLFKKYRMPLCLAVVPSWLTAERFKALQIETAGSKLFCWHQHGWTHRNHEKRGKKQEFGYSRTTQQLGMDIHKGMNRLHAILADDFYPVFTPPWNRCSADTLEILEKLNFAGVSRDAGATPPAQPTLQDFQVNVDLHTRKEKNTEESFEKLCSEIQLSISSGRSGIMLHHQRMNDNSLLLLEQLLQIFYQIKNLEVKNFKDIT